METARNLGSCKFNTPITITAKNVTYVSNTSPFLPSSVAKHFKKTRRTLLKKVSLIAESGQLLIIVGPSGSGKTTLLNVLGGVTSFDTNDEKKNWYSNRNDIQGEVRYNGRKCTKSEVRSFLSYVMAKDAFYPNTTVREIFEDAARLKLPFLSEKLRSERIDSILSSLSLNHFQHVNIGDEAIFATSASEMKRVSIGIELLRCSPVLICDEPTSGLDSRLGVQLMECLLQKAISGTTVIVTLHQPCTQMLRMCHKFLVLHDGRVAFFGTNEQAYENLNQLQIMYPPRWNCSDIYIFILSFLKDQAEREDNVEVGTSELYMIFKNEVSLGNQCLTQEDIFHHWLTSANCLELYRNIDSINYTLVTQIPPTHYSSYAPTANLDHIKVLSARAFRNIIRNRYNTFLLIIIHIFQAIIFGSIFYNLANLPNVNHNPSLLSEQFRPPHPWLDDFFSVSSKKPFELGLSPALAVYQKGFDEKGDFAFMNVSTPIDEIKKKTHNFLDNYVTCLYKQYNLPQFEYPGLPLMNEMPASDWDTWTSERIYTNIMALYQIIDYHLDYKSFKQFIDISDLLSKNCSTQSCQTQWAYNSLSTMFQCSPYKSFVNLTSSVLNEDMKKTGKKFSLEKNQSEIIFSNNNLNSRLKNNCISNLEVFRERRKRSKGTVRAVWSYINPSLTEIIDAIYIWSCRLTYCPEPICNSFNKILKSFQLWGTHLFSSAYSVLNVTGCLFLVVTLVGLLSYQALLTYNQDKVHFNRETLNGLYSPLSYYIARNMADIPLQLIPPILMATVFFLFSDFRYNFVSFILYLVIIGLTSFSGFGFGYIFSALSPRLEVAVLIGPLTLGFLLMLSGFIPDDTQVPSSIAWLKYFSFYRWAYFSTVLNQFPANGFSGNIPNNVIRQASGVHIFSLSTSMMYLFFLGIFYRIVGYFLITYTNRDIGLL
jgi:ABC-type multidrug transport system ATPase subunit